MASLIEAIDIKRKMFFEFENAPYNCLDVEVSASDRPRRADARARQDAELLDSRRLRQRRSRRARNSRSRSRAAVAATFQHNVMRPDTTSWTRTRSRR